MSKEYLDFPDEIVDVMEDDLFNDLLASVHEADAIMKGAQRPSRVDMPNKDIENNLETKDL